MKKTRKKRVALVPAGCMSTSRKRRRSPRPPVFSPSFPPPSFILLFLLDRLLKAELRNSIEQVRMERSYLRAVNFHMNVMCIDRICVRVCWSRNKNGGTKLIKIHFTLFIQGARSERTKSLSSGWSRRLSNATQLFKLQTKKITKKQMTFRFFVVFIDSILHDYMLWRGLLFLFSPPQTRQSWSWPSSLFYFPACGSWTLQRAFFCITWNILSSTKRKRKKKAEIFVTPNVKATSVGDEDMDRFFRDYSEKTNKHFFSSRIRKSSAAIDFLNFSRKIQKVSTQREISKGQTNQKLIFRTLYLKWRILIKASK